MITPLSVAAKIVPSFVDTISLILLLGKPLSKLKKMRCCCKKVPTDIELGEFERRADTKKIYIEINRIINK